MVADVNIQLRNLICSHSRSNLPSLTPLNADAPERSSNPPTLLHEVTNNQIQQVHWNKYSAVEGWVERVIYFVINKGGGGGLNILDEFILCRSENEAR